MSAGLPGVGLAGLFYLLCALLMPFLELGRTLAGRSSAQRWRVVAEQFLLAVALLVSAAGVGLLLERLVQPVRAPSTSPLLVSLAVLAVLLVVVTVSGAVSARRARTRDDVRVPVRPPGG